MQDQLDSIPAKKGKNSEQKTKVAREQRLAQILGLPEKERKFRDPAKMF